MQSHADLLAMADSQPELAGMATTLTLWIGVWPRAYLLQVGDSRCYLLRGGELTQLSRDQTMAQELVERGRVAARRRAAPAGRTPSPARSAADSTAPTVTRLNQEWGNVGILYPDGLTAHVIVCRRFRIRSSETCAVRPSVQRSPTLPHSWSSRVTVGAVCRPPIALERVCAQRVPGPPPRGRARPRPPAPAPSSGRARAGWSPAAAQEVAAAVADLEQIGTRPHPDPKRERGGHPGQLRLRVGRRQQIGVGLHGRLLQRREEGLVVVGGGAE